METPADRLYRRLEVQTGLVIDRFWLPLERQSFREISVKGGGVCGRQRIGSRNTLVPASRDGPCPTSDLSLRAHLNRNRAVILRPVAELAAGSGAPRPYRAVAADGFIMKIPRHDINGVAKAFHLDGDQALIDVRHAELASAIRAKGPHRAIAEQDRRKAIAGQYHYGPAQPWHLLRAVVILRGAAAQLSIVVGAAVAQSSVGIVAPGPYRSVCLE